MIELRYKLEPPMPNKGREDRWTLQYRYDLRTTHGIQSVKWSDFVVWSDWIDVPYVSED